MKQLVMAGLLAALAAGRGYAQGNPVLPAAVAACAGPEFRQFDF